MLGLAPDGVNALKVLGAEHTVHNIGLPVASMVVRSWTGKRLAEFGSHDGPPVFHAVWRADLYRALYDEAAPRGVLIEHGNGWSAPKTPVIGVTATRAPRRSADRGRRYPVHRPVADRSGCTAASL